MKYAVWFIILLATSSGVLCMEQEKIFMDVEEEMRASGLDIGHTTSESKVDTLREQKSEKLNKQDLQKLLNEKKNKKKEKQNGAQVWGISPHDLGTLAPVSIVMYCFNQHPKFTMVALAGLLLVVLCQSEATKSKIARLRSMLTYRWRFFKGHVLYMLSRTRF